MPVAADPVDAITEASAEGATAALFEDIRATLDVAVVNLIWRHLATMPGALEWVWGALKPLYLGQAPAIADELRRAIALPAIARYSPDTLAAAGLDREALAGIRDILDSYYHTDALALVVFSAFLSRAERASAAASQASTERPIAARRAAARTALPRLTPLSEMPLRLARLIEELNGFGEDSDTALVASMYRHLSHWPVYLALTRTLLAPLDQSGELLRLVAATRVLGSAHGKNLASTVATTALPESASAAVAAVRRFVLHPIARMTAICALMRAAMPD